MAKSDQLRFSNHLPCQTLTGLALEHLPQDGSLGRTKRGRKGAEIWRPDDRADRIYFLRRGQVVVMMGDSEGNVIIMQVIERAVRRVMFLLTGEGVAAHYGAGCY